MNLAHPRRQRACNARERIWPERGAATKRDATVWRWSPVGEKVARVESHLAPPCNRSEKFRCEWFRGDHVAPHRDRTATQGGEEAWNGLVRQWVGQNWNKALKETQAGAELNAAGKLRQALFGTPNDRAKMQAMLPPNAIQAFEDLMTAAQALARTPSSGSNTYRDTVIGEGLSASGASTLKWLTSLRAQAVKGWEGKALEENTLAVTEALLDPAKQRLLRKVVKMSDQAQQVSALTAILGGQIGARSLSAPGDDLAPIAPRKPQQR